jgi:hypothetical protein
MQFAGELTLLLNDSGLNRYAVWCALGGLWYPAGTSDHAALPSGPHMRKPPHHSSATRRSPIRSTTYLRKLLHGLWLLSAGRAMSSWSSTDTASGSQGRS